MISLIRENENFPQLPGLGGGALTLIKRNHLFICAKKNSLVKHISVQAYLEAEKCARSKRIRLRLAVNQATLQAMNLDLLEHRSSLTTRLSQIESEKCRLESERIGLTRRLEAIEVLLEQTSPEIKLVGPAPVDHRLGVNSQTSRPNEDASPVRSHPNAVRKSPRISLIGAVRSVALKQEGVFNSTQLLNEIQAEFPEFQLRETKHISSPLSDLVKKGILVLERKRVGTESNLYRVAENAVNL